MRPRARITGNHVFCKLTLPPDLMGYMDETLRNTRQTGHDDETQQYLVQFFNEVATEPSFQQQFHALNDGEKMKLQEMNAAYQQ